MSHQHVSATLLTIANKGHKRPVKGGNPCRIALSVAEVVKPLPIALLVQRGDQADPSTGVVVQAGRSIRVIHGRLMLNQWCLHFSAWVDVAVISQRSLHRQSQHGVNMELAGLWSSQLPIRGLVWTACGGSRGETPDQLTRLAMGTRGGKEDGLLAHDVVFLLILQGSGKFTILAADGKASGHSCAQTEFHTFL